MSAMEGLGGTLYTLLGLLLAAGLLTLLIESFERRNAGKKSKKKKTRKVARV